jgi:hypothetical protein
MSNPSVLRSKQHRNLNRSKQRRNLTLTQRTRLNSTAETDSSGSDDLSTVKIPKSLNLKDLLEKIRDELKIVRSRNHIYFGPYLFTCIYELGLNCNKKEFNKLVGKEHELQNINKDIVNLFKENLKWVGKFIDRIPFCYFHGNYQAEEVFKTISGVHFAFDFWSEIFVKCTQGYWLGEPIEWWEIFKDAWFETEQITDPETGPPGHWWWNIPKELISSNLS